MAVVTYEDIVSASKTGRYPNCMSDFKDDVLNNLTGMNNAIVEAWFNNHASRAF